MRVSNESEGTAGPSGAFAELFRLQSEFQARLAEETLRYLRRLQGSVMPASPGTVVVPEADGELAASGAPGGQAELALEIENLQRAHCMVTPQLTPLVSAAGVTWFPAVESGGASRLVPPNAQQRIALAITIPAELAEGQYRGALVLQGFRKSSLPVVVSVQRPKAAESTPTKGAKRARPSRKRRSP